MAQYAVGGGSTRLTDLTKKPPPPPPQQSDHVKTSGNGLLRDAVTSAPRAVDCLVVWAVPLAARSVPTKGRTVPWNTVPRGASTRMPVAPAGAAVAAARAAIAAIAATM